MPALGDVPKVPAHKERPKCRLLNGTAEIIEQPAQKHEWTPPRLY